MAKESKISPVQILMLIGAGFLIIGCFTPIITIKATALLISINKDISLTSNLNSVLGLLGMAILAFSLAIIVLIFKRYYRCIELVAGFALFVVACTLVDYLFIFSNLTANITPQVSALVNISYGIGWLFLFIGPVMILLAPRSLPVSVTDEVRAKDLQYEKFAYFIPTLAITLIVVLILAQVYW
jgi:hypothetical protein